MEPAQDNELVSCRLKLAKAKRHDLQDGMLLSQAIELAITPRTAEEQLEQLSLLFTLFKQLKSTCSSPEITSSLVDFLHQQLVPSLLPAGEITSLLKRNLERSSKPNQLRAGDVLAAAAKWSLILPPSSQSSSDPPENILSPLFWEAVGSQSRTKPNLVLLKTLVECVEWDDRLLDTVKELLEELGNSGVPALVGSTIVLLLAKFADAAPEAASSEIASLLLPYLLEGDSSSQKNTNIHRYVLPPIFKDLPDVLSVLLSEIDQADDAFSTWISLASQGVSAGYLQVGDLPSARIKDGMGHADSTVQMRTYQLLTNPKISLRLLDPALLELIKECMVLNCAVSSVATRTEYTAVTHAFFSRLSQAEITLNRSRRQQKQSPMPFLQPLVDFQAWFLRDFVDAALRKCCRPPVARVLVALIALQIFVEVVCQKDLPSLSEVFATERVQYLLACQASEYAEVRNRSMTLLLSAPIEVTTPPSSALLSSACATLSNPRRTQTEAAIAALVYLFKTCVLPQEIPEGNPEAIEFVKVLVDRLETAVARAEEGISEGMEDVGLYGYIGAARALIDCVELRPQNQRDWKPIFHRLESLVDRTWQITRSVVSLVPDEDEDDDTIAPAHEIAKAQKVLRVEGEGETGSIDVRKLISGCWRATKEASELLSTLHALYLVQVGDQYKHSERVGPEYSYHIWTVEQTNAAGRQFLVWLHEIRHRGTFSKVAVAFGKLVEAASKVPSREHLPAAWLDEELDYISTHDLSTTRRSAALPYAVLAIVTAVPSLFDSAVERLMELGNAGESDITRVHAFNILKIVLLDSRNNKELDRWLEKGVMLAVNAFSSPNWNVRNVGLILFSTLIHRALAPGRAGQDVFASRASLASRQTYESFHAKYPRILPFVADYLRHAGTKFESGHSQIFPVLIILRGLRWSAEPSGLLLELKGLVEPLLGSREWQIRKVAAQAFCSLLDPPVAIFEALNSQCIGREMDADLNLTHGRLCVFRELISNFIDHNSEVTAQHKRFLERRILVGLERRSKGGRPALAEGAMWAAISYQWQTTPSTPSYRDDLLAGANAILANEKMRRRPGGEAARWVARFFLLMEWSGSNAVEEVMPWLEKLAGEATTMSVMESLSGWSAPLPASVAVRLVNLALDKSVAESVRLSALDGLGGYWNPLKFEEGYLQALDGRWEDILRGMEEVMKGSVPLGENGFPAFAWALVSAGSAGSAEHEYVFASELKDRVNPNRSQPCRLSAVRAVRHFISRIFAGSEAGALSVNLDLALHRALLALLQDDDEEVRIEAAKTVQQGRGLGEPISSARAAILFRDHISDAFFSRSKLNERASGISWLVALVVNQEGLEEDLRILDTARSSAAAEKGEVELFEVEKPNLWRDWEGDMKMAVSILAKDGIVIHEIIEWKKRVGEALKACEGRTFSPIEAAWDAKKSLERRLRIWSALQ